MSKVKKIIICLSLCILSFAVMTACGGTKIELIDGETHKTVSVSGEFTLPKPVKKGYAFEGWFDAVKDGTAYTDSEGKGLAAWVDSNPTTLYARWSLKTYTFTLNLDGGEMDGDTSFDLEYLGRMDDLSAPTKAGFSFGGWYNSADVAVTDNKGVLLADFKQFNDGAYPINSADTGVELKAKWNTKTITYTFNSDGEVVKEISKGLGESFVLPLVKKANHTFIGWSRTDAGDDLIASPYTATDTDDANTSLYARYHTSTVAGVSFVSINKDSEYKVSYTQPSQGFDTEIYIPDTYMTKPVTQVGKIRADAMTKLVLPHTVTAIDADSMLGQANLIEIRLPAALNAIPARMLDQCSKLKSVKLPDTITGIGDGAFRGTDISEIFIPQGVRSIGSMAFNTFSMTKIETHGGNNFYEAIDGVLYEKSGTTLKLQQYPKLKTGANYVPDNRTVEIMKDAFIGVGINDSKIITDALTSVTIGGKISKVGDSAFAASSLMRVDITLESASLEFADRAFNCDYLRTVMCSLNSPFKLGTSVFKWDPFFGSSSLKIYVPSAAVSSYKTASGWSSYSSRIKSKGDIYGDYAIANVGDKVSLSQYVGTESNVVINEYINGKLVVSIGAECFFGANNIKTVTLPSNVNSIGSKAFSLCLNLEYVYTKALTPPALAADAFNDTNSNFNIYVDGDPSAYRTAANWNAFASRISTKI